MVAAPRTLGNARSSTGVSSSEAATHFKAFIGIFAAQLEAETPLKAGCDTVKARFVLLAQFIGPIKGFARKYACNDGVPLLSQQIVASLNGKGLSNRPANAHAVLGSSDDLGRKRV
jgi:hypothetical protein